jgi:hypothetical protein
MKWHEVSHELEGGREDLGMYVLIGRNILKMGRQSEYQNPNQLKVKHFLSFQCLENILCLSSDGG